MTVLQLDRFAPVRVRYLSQQSWNKHKQASCCTQRVNGQFPPAPIPSQRQLPPEMDCPMDSHDVCEHVYVCSLGQIYILGHVASGLKFCRLGCICCRATGLCLFISVSEDQSDTEEHLLLFFFDFPKISRRTEKNKTSQWVICWKMALSCSLQSPWERDIQVSLQLQKSLVHAWYNV